MRGSRDRIKLVASTVTAALVIIGIVALLEKGPPNIVVYSGAAPENPGYIGTMYTYIYLRHYYPNTIVVTSARDFSNLPRSRHCLYIVISPTKNMSSSYIESLLRWLRSCDEGAVFVADESRYSNALLRAIGSSIRIEGSILLNVTNLLPYPSAFVSIGNFSGWIRLDIASSLVVASRGPRIVGYIPIAVVYIPRKRVSLGIDVPIAAVQDLGRLRVLVFGDGSPFLNQVILSPHGAAYRELLLSIVSYLCGGDRSCVKAFDGASYAGVPIQDALRRPSIIFSLGPAAALAALAARFLHPSTWVPLALSYLQGFTSQILSNRFFTGAVAGLCIIAVWIAMLRRLRPSRDERLREQIEVETLATMRLRRAIVERRYELTKRDFLALYAMIDDALRGFLGISLDDPRAVEILSRYVDEETARRFVEEMNRLKRKAEGRSLLPIVISWRRTIERMIRFSERVLKELGLSIEGGLAPR